MVVFIILVETDGEVLVFVVDRIDVVPKLVAVIIDITSEVVIAVM